MELVVADPGALEERDRLSASVWGGGVPAAEFVRRERELRTGLFSRRSHTGFAWCGPGGRVLASCETYEAPFREPDGRVGRAWLVASVFTEPALRGRGFASAMLGALLDRLRSEPGARWCALFSDIGPGIYERLGFVAEPAFDHRLPAERIDGPWRSLDVHPERSGPGLWPTAAQLDWQVARAAIRARAEGRDPLGTVGAELRGETVTWLDDPDGDALVVTSLTAPELAPAAQRAASDRGRAWVVVWDTGLPGLGPTTPRAGALPMVVRLGGAAGAFGPVHRGSWV